MPRNLHVQVLEVVALQCEGDEGNAGLDDATVQLRQSLATARPLALDLVCSAIYFFDGGFRLQQGHELIALFGDFNSQAKFRLQMILDLLDTTAS